MITIRKSTDRGHFDHGWLDTYHSFSFGEYHDPNNMGFRSLRVINEDRVAPGRGFGMHPHKNMEIVTYVLEGALQHKDSMGNGEVLRPGEVQRMTAGTGILHSEFNPSNTDPVHLLQIWLLPAQAGIEPSYEQKDFSDRLNRHEMTLIASPDAKDGSVAIHQDARVYACRLAKNGTIKHALEPSRHAWLQLVRGELDLNGTNIAAGDAASISQETMLSITPAMDCEFLLFDLA
jgi:quercetin 2,3-dioxygenase